MRGVAMGAGLVLGLLSMGWVGAEVPKGKARYTVSPQTTVVTEPLKGDGAPDYLGALNARYGKGVKGEENGFVMRVRMYGAKELFGETWAGAALRLLGIEEKGEAKGWERWETYLEKAKDAKEGEETLEEAGMGMWTEKEHPVLARYLKAREEDLALVAEAARKPKWWVPYVGKSVLGARLPALFREECSALRARATLRAGAGDWAGCVEDLKTMRMLARKVAGGATLLEASAGGAQEKWACQTVGALAGSGGVTAEGCAALRGAMFKAMPGQADVMDVGERYVLLDAFVTVSGSKGQMYAGQDPILKLGTLEAGQVDWDVALRVANGHVDEVVKVLKAPVAERMKGARELDARLNQWESAWLKHNDGHLWMDKEEAKAAYSERVARAYLCALGPPAVRAVTQDTTTRLYGELAEVVLAAARYKAEKGAWPEKLEALVPGYLGAVPADGFGEGLIRMRVREGKLRVYSVGVNGKDEEGGGDDVGVGG